MARLSVQLEEFETNLRARRGYAAATTFGAGEDGLFGTEAIGVIQDALGRASGGISAQAEAELRRQVQEDNVVEVGG